ncbi:MAG: hypothetical protein M3Q19_12480 [Pseudomonadota bacterium]|nr:hypothetical protein [Pseudomonadota bacterium]
MRILFPVAIIALAAGHAVAAQKPALIPPDCPKVTSHMANGSAWRNDPAKPKKLTELPPADAYAAVYRTDERGCVLPVKYRDTRR